MRSFLLTLCVLFTGVAFGQDVSKVTLKDLSFITGSWSGEVDGIYAEEHWTAPRGNNVMGMYREMQGDKAIFFEFLDMEQTENGPVIRMKHFNGQLVGREEKDQSNVFELTDFKDGYALWEVKASNVRLSYRREGADGLVAILDKTNKNGKKIHNEYRYTRMK